VVEDEAVIGNLARTIQKAGFAIFMISLVAIAIGLARDIMPLFYAGLAAIGLCVLVVLVRINRAVAKRPRRAPASDGATPGAGKTSSSSSSRRSSSISDPDRY
jgi:hypothetical protein